MTEYTFTGTTKYAFVQSANKFGKYSLNLYVDDKTRKAIKATGTKNGLKEDDDGFFYVFRSDFQPEVIDEAGQNINDIPGDGSSVTVTVTVEPYTSKKFGDGTRTKLRRVLINNLVPYAKPEAISTPQSEREVPA